jgi:hypothetical protein
MQCEQLVDPFQIVRLLRANRKEFINQVNLFQILVKGQFYISLRET